MKGPTQSKPTGLSAEVATVAELVNYQNGSIVSREIVKRPTGTATVFAFDEGQGLSEHTAPSGIASGKIAISSGPLSFVSADCNAGLWPKSIGTAVTKSRMPPLMENACTTRLEKRVHCARPQGRIAKS